MSDALEPQVLPEAKPVETPYLESVPKLTGNDAVDLANIAKEQGLGEVTDVLVSGEIVRQAAPQSANPQTEAQPVQTVQTAAPEVKPQAPVEVPAKFKNPDGTVNVERIAKAESNLDEMVARYKAKEREAQQLQNRVNNAPQQVQQPPQFQQPQGYQQQMLTPLEIQMAQDIMAESAQFGKAMEQAHAIALARVQARALAARYEADTQNTQELRRRIEDAERTRELQSLISSDPQLLSEGMVDKLWQIRQDKPWINNSAEPWKEAYIYYRGMNQGHAGQVSTPNPQRTTAPPVPVGPVTRVQPQVDVTNPKSLTNEQLIAEIRKIHPTFRG
jgi:hypothetical protein